jgi:hypothetical protein
MLGLFALMVALVATLAATSSAPASAKSIDGKLNVYAYNTIQAGLGGINAASVVVLDPTGQAIVKGSTDAGGFFSSYLPEGVYKLTVTAQGFQPFSTAIKIAVGQSTSIQAGLVPTSAQATDGKLNVYAYNVMQPAVGGINAASVTVLNSTGNAIVNGTTDTKGYFSSYVPEGVYKLRVVAPGFQEFSTPIKIAAGQSTTVKAELTRAPSPQPISTSTPTPTNSAPTTATSTLVPR